MSEETVYTANPGKQLIRTVDGVDYQRIPIKTHLITKADRMEDVVLQYAGDRMQEGDILFISEKAVACTQSRAIPMEDINLVLYRRRTQGPGHRRPHRGDHPPL